LCLIKGDVSSATNLLPGVVDEDEVLHPAAISKNFPDNDIIRCDPPLPAFGRQCIYATTKRAESHQIGITESDLLVRLNYVLSMWKNIMDVQEKVKCVFPELWW
jgi:hypothetical protein